MTYKPKKVTPSINRRISMSFRDIELKQIFESTLKSANQISEILDLEISQNRQLYKIDSLMNALCITLDTYLKCLQYDYLAILLNETMDEPQNNVRSPFSIFAHPLLRQQNKQTPPTLQRKSRFYTLA